MTVEAFTHTPAVAGTPEFVYADATAIPIDLKRGAQKFEVAAGDILYVSAVATKDKASLHIMIGEEAKINPTPTPLRDDESEPYGDEEEGAAKSGSLFTAEAMEEYGLVDCAFSSNNLLNFLVCPDGKLLVQDARAQNTMNIFQFPEEITSRINA